MNEQYSRSIRLIGEEGLEKLKQAHVAVFGVGGVGGYAIEALARSGVGHLTIVDHDTVSLSNLNRQIIATRDTVGQSKVELMKARIASIDPDIEVQAVQEFFLPQNADTFAFEDWDYIIDAIDTVTAKLELIEKAQAHGVPLLCCMGTGNRLDPSRLHVVDLYETSRDPLARVMRHECRKRGIAHVQVLCSDELPVTPKAESKENKGNHPSPGSMAFVPPAAGLLAASIVVRSLVDE